MSKLPEKKEEVTGKCPACRKEVVCRMTTYTNYDNYLQWQNLDANKAHYTSGGKCAPASKDYMPATPRAENRLVESPVTPSNLDKIQIDTHNQCWEFALREATKVYPEKFKGGNLSSGDAMRLDINLISRMILAQVFYKKNMDYITFHTNKG